MPTEQLKSVAAPVWRGSCSDVPGQLPGTRPAYIESRMVPRHRFQAMLRCPACQEANAVCATSLGTTLRTLQMYGTQFEVHNTHAFPSIGTCWIAVST